MAMRIGRPPDPREREEEERERVPHIHSIHTLEAITEHFRPRNIHATFNRNLPLGIRELLQELVSGDAHRALDPSIPEHELLMYYACALFSHDTEHDEAHGGGHGHGLLESIVVAQARRFAAPAQTEVYADPIPTPPSLRAAITRAVTTTDARDIPTANTTLVELVSQIIPAAIHYRVDLGTVVTVDPNEQVAVRVVLDRIASDPNWVKTMSPEQRQNVVNALLNVVQTILQRHKAANEHKMRQHPSIPAFIFACMQQELREQLSVREGDDLTRQAAEQLAHFTVSMMAVPLPHTPETPEPEAREIPPGGSHLVAWAGLALAHGLQGVRRGTLTFLSDLPRDKLDLSLDTIPATKGIRAGLSDDAIHDALHHIPQDRFTLRHDFLVVLRTFGQAREIGWREGPRIADVPFLRRFIQITEHAIVEDLRDKMLEGNIADTPQRAAGVLRTRFFAPHEKAVNNPHAAGQRLKNFTAARPSVPQEARAPGRIDFWELIHRASNLLEFFHLLPKTSGGGGSPPPAPPPPAAGAH